MTTLRLGKQQNQQCDNTNAKDANAEQFKYLDGRFFFHNLFLATTR